jgi:hypothetical protein
MLFGHLAVSALQHHYLRVDPAPVIAGGVFPDLVDKTLCQVLHRLPSGRMYAHTLVAVGLSAAVVRLIWGRQAARSWALGYLGHLIGDSGGFVPWLYPVLPYDFLPDALSLREIVRRALANPRTMVPDLALSAWAVSAWWWEAREMRLNSPVRTICRFQELPHETSRQR